MGSEGRSTPRVDEPTVSSIGPGVSHLMTPREVGELFRVDAKTVTRWARTGKLDCIRTLGGHRRFERAEVQRLYDERTVERSETSEALTAQAATARLLELQVVPT
jgi:excisionase family DNA binding protein